MNRLDTPAWCCISDSDGRWYSTIWCYSGVKETESNALYFLCSLARENIFAFLDDPATGDVSAGIQIPYSCMTSESSSHYFTYVVSATSKPAPQTESPYLLVLYVYLRRSLDTRYRSASGILTKENVQSTSHFARNARYLGLRHFSSMECRMHPSQVRLREHWLHCLPHHQHCVFS